MNKQKITLLIGIIVTAALTGFFLTKTPVNKDAKQPCTTSTSTDCLRPTPIGTSYYVPPEEKSLATTTQSGKIDEHITINNTLRDVNFCGKTYKVKQVFIDGVDVVQRIAEILTKDLVPTMVKVGPYGPRMDEWKTLTMKKGEMASGLCSNIQNNMVNGMTIEVNNIKKFKSTDVGLGGGEIYMVVVSDQLFDVVQSTGEIYNISGYDGAFVGPIGKLK